MQSQNDSMRNGHRAYAQAKTVWSTFEPEKLGRMEQKRYETAYA